MKINLILLLVFLGLLLGSYNYFEKDMVKELTSERERDYLINWNLNQNWKIKLVKGELVRQGDSFLWNDKELASSDKNLVKLLNRIGDLRVIKSVRLESWRQSVGVKFNWRVKEALREFEVGMLNELTGRFMLKELKSNTIYLIEDAGVIEQLYKDFEQGQKIKYYELIDLINKLEW